MSTKATVGAGVAFKRGDAATPEVFTALAEVTDVKGPGAKSDSKEATSLDSVNYKEFVPGLIDPGEMDLTLNFADATAYGLLKGDQESRATHNYEVTFPVGVTTKKFSFAAFVTELAPALKPSDVITFSAKLKISGAITFA